MKTPKQQAEEMARKFARSWFAPGLPEEYFERLEGEILEIIPLEELIEVARAANNVFHTNTKQSGLEQALINLRNKGIEL